MFTTETHHRVRYAETDKMGYLYYGHYPMLYEIGRVEMLRDLGIPYISIEDDYKVMLPVLHVDAKYIGSAYYDDLLTIRSTIKELPTKMITVYTEILNAEGNILHKAVVKLFFIDMLTQKRISSPDFFTAPLKQYFV